MYCIARAWADGTIRYASTGHHTCRQAHTLGQYRTMPHSEHTLSQSPSRSTRVGRQDHSQCRTSRSRLVG
eukprot:864880-Rhodomonas_salina.1